MYPRTPVETGHGQGSIHIAWTVEQTPEGPQLVLLWQEKDGPPVSSPLQTGFGSKVIERGLAYELNGTAHLDYKKDGVVCTMVIPMAALIPPSNSI